MEAVEKYNGGIMQFTGGLNKPPAKAAIKKNKLANDSDYLPISYIENKLDELFGGLWTTENFKSQTVANEIIGQIELKVFHPILNNWITRTGVASVPIQFKSGSDITILTNKIKNTLVKDYPHLKAECIKNAAKSLGKLFGRDLNREFVDNYNPVLSLPQDGKLELELEATLETYTDKKELVQNALKIRDSFLSKGMDAAFVESKIKLKAGELK